MAGAPLLSRRDALIGAAYACCLPVFKIRAAAASGAFATREVAPGVHVREGVDAEATAGNAGAIANLGCIVGRDAVAVVDAGGSLADGARWRDSIRAITKLPIRYVILSHVHPDHIFGAGAFSSDDPVYVGHARLPEALAQRAQYYRGRLEQVIGNGGAGPAVTPTMLVEDRATLDLGARTLELTAHPVAHTDCDLSVLDRQTGTLFPSDLLFVRRVPSLDGSITGWLKELTALRELSARRAVPGHGPAVVDWPAGGVDLERYLNVLLKETREAIARGIDINTAAQSVAQSERGRWALFEDYHGHNVTKAFKELEWE